MATNDSCQPWGPNFDELFIGYDLILLPEHAIGCLGGVIRLTAFALCVTVTDDTCLVCRTARPTITQRGMLHGGKRQASTSASQQEGAPCLTGTGRLGEGRRPDSYLHLEPEARRREPRCGA